MNNMKKFASLLLALVMVLAMAVPAMAEDSETVTNDTSHTYVAYQIFKGTQATSEGALGDVEWGDGVKSAELLTAIQNDARFNETTGEGTEAATANIFKDCKTAADVANVLAGYEDKSEVAKAFANVVAENLTNVSHEIKDEAKLAAGYYLIVDTTNVDEKYDANNSALLQVTDDITIEVKYTVPSVDKTITGEGEAADYNIGDSVPFTLTGTLPSNYADYETYTYIFHDTLSAGLTYNNDAKVYVVNGSEKTEVTTFFSITSNNNVLTVSCDNLKTIMAATINASSKIVVEYTATLNTEANIGSAGNKNEVILEFSNNPNAEGEGEEDTGKTPKDEVIVFTYELDVTKTDNKEENPAKLKDAEFVLYRKVTGEDNAEVKKYVQVNTDGKVTGWTSDKTQASTLKSDENGLFKVIGLDAGDYWLEETKAPAGYNLLKAPIKVTIAATITDTEETQKLDSLTISINDGTAANGNVTNGIVGTTVVNNPGSTLPETGGMGTTVIYVAGGLLVAAAVILMVAKRRRAA